MRVGTLSQLWRYPVKSMGGERLDTAALSLRGIPGDRGWAVFDESRSGVTTAKRLPPLRACRARYPSEPDSRLGSPPAEITLPDGTMVSTDSAEATLRLGELLGRAVSLCPLGPAGSEAAPRITAAGESPDTIRALMGILPGEPEADLSAFTPERLRLLRHGNFFDAYSIHLITRTTLRTLSRLAPESDWDERRFRANLLVESDDDGYPELAWVGRRLRVGTALIEVVMGCPRCVMVTLPEDDLPQDHRIMRTLVRETRHTAGIYASVVEEGGVREGDPVEVLD
ncbi:MAG: MOSC domain-containing protein [Candidatus Eisenbacteria bacterium]|uniref:MOSC domain-containing protein n=1 Tax=Eiseniibacteriota bacterium TaxID=2212470 RepID=A0A849SC61_UNCEI|nr:MOSC domain-containing protein [Candidatus Eisenbacteria bacterium]